MKKLLAIIGIHATPTCPCIKHMKEMDRNGPEWCRQNIETIVDWMAKEAEKRKLPFLRTAGKRLVKIAIWKFERQEKKRKAEKAKRKSRSKLSSGGTGPPVQKVKLDGCRRNLLYHIYPMTGSREVWQWNLDQIIQRIDLFNGRRIVGIVHDDRSDPPEAVIDYLGDHVDDYVIRKNIKKQGEGVTYAPMMEQIESFDKNEVTFRCHAKAVSKSPSQLQLIQKWTEIMYAVCLDDWQHVKSQLEECAITGPFRRQTRMAGASWFYSGAFYWFRNRDVFQRNWRSIHKMRVGIETWPFMVFQLAESDCVFGDLAGSLYQQNYMDEHALPEYQQWLKEHVPNRVIVDGRNQHPRWLSEQEFYDRNLAQLYQIVSTTSSDICEHCTTLRELAGRCESVTEFGTRYGVSTIALLAGEPSRMVSYDIERKESVSWIERACEKTDYQFVLGDTLKIETIRPTDLLFIDTEHTYKQLKGELSRHGRQAKKHIVFHDTAGKTGNKLRPAINEFIAENPEWSIRRDFPNNNGLMVLSRTE